MECAYRSITRLLVSRRPHVRCHCVSAFGKFIAAVLCGAISLPLAPAIGGEKRLELRSATLDVQALAALPLSARSRLLDHAPFWKSPLRASITFDHFSTDLHPPVMTVPQIKEELNRFIERAMSTYSDDSIVRDNVAKVKAILQAMEDDRWAVLAIDSAAIATLLEGNTNGPMAPPTRVRDQLILLANDLNRTAVTAPLLARLPREDRAFITSKPPQDSLSLALWNGFRGMMSLIEVASENHLGLKRVLRQTESYAQTWLPQRHSVRGYLARMAELDLLEKEQQWPAAPILRQARDILAPTVGMPTHHVIVLPEKTLDALYAIGLSKAEKSALGYFEPFQDATGETANLITLSEILLSRPFQALQVLCHEIAHARQGAAVSKLTESRLGVALVEGTQAFAEAQEFERLLHSPIRKEVEAIIELEFRAQRSNVSEHLSLNEKLAYLLGTGNFTYMRERRFARALAERMGVSLRFGQPFPRAFQLYRNGDVEELRHQFGPRSFAALNHLINRLHAFASGRQPLIDTGDVLGLAASLFLEADTPTPRDWKIRINAWMDLIKVLSGTPQMPDTIDRRGFLKQQDLPIETYRTLGRAILSGKLSLENVRSAIEFMRVHAQAHDLPEGGTIHTDRFRDILPKHWANPVQIPYATHLKSAA